MAKAQPRSLSGLVVAITGGARGIGRSVTEALVAEGSRVAVGDIDLDLAQKTAEEIGSNVEAFSVDVTDRDSFATFLDQAEESLGPIEVLVNNAGIMVVGPLMDRPDSAIKRELDINLYGVITGTQLALERMLKRGSGHIVNIASAAGKVGLPGEAVYCATKHGVVGFTEATRLEFADSGVDFSYVMPSLANTELASGMHTGRFPKMIEPHDIAAAIVDALKNRKVEVYVPKSLSPLFKSVALMPTKARDRMNKLFKTDEVATDVDQSARKAYAERTTGSVVK